MSVLNPLNAKLNPICHLLALLGAHPILHVSRVRLNLRYQLTWYYKVLGLNGESCDNLQLCLQLNFEVFLLCAGKSNGS